LQTIASDDEEERKKEEKGVFSKKQEVESNVSLKEKEKVYTWSIFAGRRRRGYNWKVEEGVNFR